ncbi:MAG: nucleotide-binding protein [Clostridia bacterium]|nr:nucleotide-binding protein [Clostridia bacterium]
MTTRRKTFLPKTIVFSSSERSKVRDRLIRLLRGVCTAKSWDKDFFLISQASYTAFQHLSEKYDFAIVILSPDDMVKCRGKKYMQPRDNLLFELGVSFQLPSKRIIVFSHENCKIPGDVDGFQRIVWTDNMSDVEFSAEIKNYIEKITLDDGLLLTWSECMSSIKKLHEKMKVSNKGYHYHAIVGIEGGGGIPADLLAREGAHRCPVFMLNADRSGGKGLETFEIPLNEHVLAGIRHDYQNHQQDQFYNILVVDNVARSGENISKAKDYLKDHLQEENINIKAAVVFLNSALKDLYGEKIDFYGSIKNFDSKTSLKLAD